MSTRRVAYLIYNGAVYVEALERPQFRKRYDEPGGAPRKAPVAPEVKEKAQKWQQRFNEPDAGSEQEARRRLDEIMRKQDKPAPPPAGGGPAPTKQPVDIALTYKKIAPIWFALHDYAKEIEQQLNQSTKAAFDAHAKTLLRWFTALAKKSDHADVRAIGRLLERVPSAYNLFKYTPPDYSALSRYFDEGDVKSSSPAMSKFIRRLNEVAKDQGWNIHS